MGGVVFGPTISTGSWPAGATITLINNGKILGRGGDGGFVNDSILQANGLPGATAIKATFPITIINNNLIGGGGGGGALGSLSGGPLVFPGGGGGGAGRANGKGGSYPLPGSILTGQDGTDTDGGAGGGIVAPGGDGGDLGQAGGSSPSGSGGAAGAAIDGSAFVTLSVAGDIRGAQI